MCLLFSISVQIDHNCIYQLTRVGQVLIDGKTVCNEAYIFFCGFDKYFVTNDLFIITCHDSSIVEGLGAEARRLSGAREGGSCRVTASNALVCDDINCDVIVWALIKYAVAGSNPFIMPSSILQKYFWLLSNYIFLSSILNV